MKYPCLKLHQYVWVGVAVFAASAVSFPIAMLRVSQTDKFAGQPFNSWTCKGQVPTERTVTQFSTCVQFKPTSRFAD